MRLPVKIFLFLFCCYLLVAPPGLPAGGWMPNYLHHHPHPYQIPGMPHSHNYLLEDAAANPPPALPPAPIPAAADLLAGMAVILLIVSILAIPGRDWLPDQPSPPPRPA